VGHVPIIPCGGGNSLQHFEKGDRFYVIGAGGGDKPYVAVRRLINGKAEGKVYYGPNPDGGGFWEPLGDGELKAASPLE
jgi:hypothetical protein